MKATLATLVLAPALALTTPAGAAPKTACAAVDVSSDTGTSQASRFTVSKTIDLTFSILFAEPVSGDHLAEFNVFTPDGHLYRSLSVPYTDGTRQPASRTVPGYPRAVDEKKASNVRRGALKYQVVTASLPVGGTDIVSSGLYGKWKVEVRIDGAETTCTSPTSFVLVP